MQYLCQVLLTQPFSTVNMASRKLKFEKYAIWCFLPPFFANFKLFTSPLWWSSWTLWQPLAGQLLFFSHLGYLTPYRKLNFALFGLVRKIFLDIWKLSLFSGTENGGKNHSILGQILRKTWCYKPNYCSDEGFIM